MLHKIHWFSEFSLSIDGHSTFFEEHMNGNSMKHQPCLLSESISSPTWTYLNLFQPYLNLAKYLSWEFFDKCCLLPVCTYLNLFQLGIQIYPNLFKPIETNIQPIQNHSNTYPNIPNIGIFDIKTYLRFIAVKILYGVFRAKWQTKSEKCPFQIQVLNQNRQRTGLKMMTKRVLFSMITFSNTDKNNRKTKKFKFIQDKSRIFLLFWVEKKLFWRKRMLSPPCLTPHWPVVFPRRELTRILSEKKIPTRAWSNEAFAS